MGSKKCETCGEWSFLYPENHRCPPKWRVYDADDMEPEDGEWIYAPDSQMAAEKYCEETDPYCDYRTVDGEVQVIVEDDQGNKAIFFVSAELTPTYRATKVEKEQGKEDDGQ